MSYYSPNHFTDAVSDRDSINLVLLNINTPLGLFETNGGNLYLIAPQDDDKVAIALRHKVERPFSWIRLTPEHRADGYWLGRAKINPIGHSDRISGHLPIGSISSDDLVSNLLCRTEDGDCEWISLGPLIGEPWLSYDRWQIEVANEVFSDTGECPTNLRNTPSCIRRRG